MRILFLLLIFFWSGSKAYTQERYEEKIFSEIEISTLTYSDTLKLDFYQAKKDTVGNKPLLLLVHGGGFAIGKRDNPLEKKFCTDLAQRGYAVASMSYRLLRKGKSFGCDCPASDKIETFLEVSRDVLAATRFLSDKTAELKFDKNKIILVGSSAGAEAVLNTAFMEYRHDFKSLPYSGLKFVGLVSFAGAVIDVDYISSENAIPTLMFHGEKDNLVPFGNAPHHYCPENSTGYLMLDGSEAIARKLKELDVSYQLMYDPEGNHDWANLAYERIDVVSEFIKRVIVGGEHRQSKIKIRRTE